MKYLFTAATLFAASVVADKRDLCSDGSVDDGGNWYCQAVEAITYTGVGGQGSYNRITNMNPDADPGSQCSSESRGYSGNLSPLDEEVRCARQMRLSAPCPSKLTDDAAAKGEVRTYVATRMATVMATSTAEGKLIRRLAIWLLPLSTALSRLGSAESSPTSTVDTQENWLPGLFDGGHGGHGGHDSSEETSASSTAAPSSSSESSSSSSSSGGWGRQAYYDSSSTTAEGLVFLNHMGGTGSGTFDYTFGNSLAYSTSDGMGGAANATTLDDCTIPSEGEVIIMSDKECSGDDCGYYRPETVAHHGFDGPSKAFFFEFQMPISGETAASKSRELCSTGKPSAPAGNLAVASSTFSRFLRQVTSVASPLSTETSPAAMVLDNNNIHIKVLEDSVDFGTSMDYETIQDICVVSEPFSSLAFWSFSRKFL
ncbi:hypothetical protein KC349_g57 [Hortaea werneckii]|nr:hypothetical protein KC349_g57 [Hortaea werneckii]